MSHRPLVVEIGASRAVAWAGKLLADAGCDVLRIDEVATAPASPLASALDTLLHHGKRRMQRSGTTAADLADLLTSAAGLLIDLPAATATARGLDAASLRARFPSLVTLSITPFGVTGPRANYAATELILTNAGGWASLCPSTHTDPALPPLKVHGEHCSMMTAVAGATAWLATLRDAQRCGHGEYIDLSIQAYVANVLEAALPATSSRGVVPMRYHPRSLLPWRIFEAKDGPVFLVCIEQDQWERLVAFMGNPDWAQLEIFADAPARALNQDVLHTFLAEFIAGWHRMELFHAAQQHRIGVAPVLDYAALQDAEHIRARGFFTTLARDGATPLPAMANAVLTSAGRLGTAGPGTNAPSTTSRPATVATSAERPRRPLEGIRVVDASWAWAGPFCSLNLAHLGAEVIRVESTVRPDLYRRFLLYTDEFGPSLDRSAMFNQWNQGKRSVACALNTPAGRTVFEELVAKSDVVVQNFATGVLDRLGIGYDRLRAINPGIVLASVSGFGQQGPWREYLGYGPSAAALTGLCAATGYLGGGPEELGLSMPDPTSGITAAYGVLAALRQRDATGVGTHIDVSLWEATAALGIDGWAEHAVTGRSPTRQGNRDTQMAPHGVYRCVADDSWVAIAVQDDARWQRLATMIDPSLGDDARFATLASRKVNEDALDALISQWCASQDRWTITRLLQAEGIAAFPTFTCRDVLDDAYLNERGFIERLPHPVAGVRPHTGIPWRMTTRPNGVQRAAPCAGADTDAVLRDVLGYDAQHIAMLRADGILQ